MRQLIIIFIIFYTAALLAATDYSGYKVYDVSPTKNQMSMFHELEFEDGFDIFSHGSIDNPARIMVDPANQKWFLEFLDKHAINYKLIIDNVDEILKADKISRINSRAKISEADDKPNFEVYWSYSEMEKIFNRLATNYPDIVKLDNLGKSIENRNIYGVRVSKNKEFGKNPIIYIDAGTHAREWAGIQSAFYFLHELVENPTVQNELLYKLDFVFVPVVNPDGYEFSFTKDRMWRKNRRVVNSTCIGIDLNRNYPYMWRYVANSCRGDGHPGPSALSEPEASAVAKYMESFKNNLRLYLSTHSYGPVVLWPFGYAFNVYVKNWKEHQTLGEAYANAINEATKTKYKVGNSADILYTANGASDDFAIAYANADFAFTLELPGGGKFGFDYPQDKIHTLVKETFIGYRAMALYIKQRFNA